MNRSFLLLQLCIFCSLAPAISLQAQQLPMGFSPQQISTHIMDPIELRGITSTEPQTRMPLVVQPLGRFTAIIPKLDVNSFGQELHNKVKDQVTGYAMQLRKNGAPIYTLIWNWSQTPADASQGWKLDTRMHIASVSKYISTVAMVKLLDAKGISIDAKIINYLPSYWTKGANIDKISFRHLMTHTSGFNTGTGKADFIFMKQQVAAGTGGVGAYHHENMNFGLLRILLAVINGNVNTNFTVGNLTDQTWDLVAISAYKQYCQSNIFNPAGVANASFEPLANFKNALAYKFPHQNLKGLNTGNLASFAGSDGWRISVEELLKIMDQVRRKNTIVSSVRAQQILDAGLGINGSVSSPAGKLYYKTGYWGAGGSVEQSVIYYLPEGMELVMLVNSPISGNNWSLGTLISDLYLNNLQ